MPNPNDMVRARRKEGYGDVSVPVNAFLKDSPVQMWVEGSCIMMRYEEALDRDDCEPVDEDDNVIAEGAPDANTNTI